jgi:hypothetical protein
MLSCREEKVPRRNVIVESALQLLREVPTMPALDILDAAMKDHEGAHPDFESFDPVTGRKPHPAYSDDTDAFSPFGELLRRAFAPNLDPRELMLLNPIEPHVSTELQARATKVASQWQEAIEKFADRYRLWS